MWVLWIILAVVLAAGEVLSLSFFLAPFAAGALIAAMVDLAGAGDALALLAFLVSSVALLAFVRPIARRHLYTPAQVRTGTAALVGRTAVALERVDAERGSVKLEGEVWSARSFDDDEAIETGLRVYVVEIRGATALVTAT